jgi:hypothetical protein
MRHTYELSTETIKVLNGSATKVAEEMHVDPSYLHQILGKTQTDPFAKFVFLFDAAVRVGLDVSPWLNRLEATVARYRPAQTHSPFECLARKIDTDAATTRRIVTSLEDGEITDAEICRIQTSIRAERKVLDELELGLLRATEPRKQAMGSGK